MSFNVDSAEELVDTINEKRLAMRERAYTALSSKCADAINTMGKDLTYQTTVELTDEDLSVLTDVTEELRGLNYKFRFIQIKNADGEILGHELLISIMHLK